MGMDRIDARATGERVVRTRAPKSHILAIVALLATQIASLAPSFPYYLSYYNPLFGGPARAARMMMIGWGEGFDQAAAYLNALPDAAATTVLAGPWSTPFSYLYDGTSLTAAYVSRDAGSVGRTAVRAGDPLLQWIKADYRVVYIAEQQRGMIPQGVLDHLAARTPVMSVTLQGLEYARVYDIRHDPPPAAYLNGDAGTTDWDGVIRLVAYELSMRGYAPGSSVALTTYVQVLDPESFNADHLSLLVRVVASNGTMISTASPKPLRQRQDRVIWPVVTRVRIPADVQPGRYHIEVTVQSESTGTAAGLVISRGSGRELYPVHGGNDCCAESSRRQRIAWRKG